MAYDSTIAILCPKQKHHSNHGFHSFIILALYRPDGTSGKTSASGTGGIGLNPETVKSPTRCKRHATDEILKYALCRKAAEMGIANLWHPKGYLLSEYNEDLIFLCLRCTPEGNTNTVTILA